MMKKYMCRLLVLAVAAGGCSMQVRADYPIASHRYLADPSILVTKERVYVYCSNDDESPVEGKKGVSVHICTYMIDLPGSLRFSP